MITPCESWNILDLPLRDFRIKRDDLFPLVGGGNKARKIQYIVESALLNGYDSLVTNGGVQSNHARATALMAAKLGMKCSLILHTPFPEVMPELTGNYQLMKISGAHIRFCELTELSFAMDEEMRRLSESGLNPLYIWGGGHCIEGTKAYYDAAIEAKKQCEGWVPDFIVLASGTGTTQAGLVAGYANLPTRVLGISVAREKDRGKKIIKESLMEYSNFSKKDYSNETIYFSDSWTEGGYERTSPRIYEVILKAAKKGLVLDPTYTAKAYLGLKELIATGEIKRNSRVLFWHTGGLLNLISSSLMKRD